MPLKSQNERFRSVQDKYKHLENTHYLVDVLINRIEDLLEKESPTVTDDIILANEIFLLKCMSKLSIAESISRKKKTWFQCLKSLITKK